MTRPALMPLLILATAGILPAAAQAQDGHAGHGAAPAAEEAPATTAYRLANDRMHADMTIVFTGDADADFALGMIPHHQGAIDMAELLLEHGKDADARALATAIIRAQEEEIALMQEWLATRAE
jgi:uncharacterized protein (DUF305 family)